MTATAAQAYSQACPTYFFIFMVLGSLFLIISTIIAVVVWCFLFHKAGYSWAWGLLVLVPVAQVIVPLYLAFSDWPVRKELRLLKKNIEEKEKLKREMNTENKEE